MAIENPDAPELQFCRTQKIRISKRDELLSTILQDKNLKLVAVAGTHGKTTTTAMAIWLMTRLGIPLSYSVGGKISFGEMGHYDAASEYFVYEADEFDRNFLSFQPYLSIITGVDWDHPDIYPTRQDYETAFQQFIGQSNRAVLWQEDYDKHPSKHNGQPSELRVVVDKADPAINTSLKLPGRVNREDAWQVVQAGQLITGLPLEQLVAQLNAFPGVSRRFELLAPQLYSDYAHTPPKIRGTLETAEEVAPGKVVVVYEGLHNTRQHFIKDELRDLFKGVKQLYIVPSYLAREDESLALLGPADLRDLLSPETQANTTAAALDPTLLAAIRQHVEAGDTVVCISAGGGGSLDEWIRHKIV